jgi:hypothetical protein
MRRSTEPAGAAPPVQPHQLARGGARPSCPAGTHAKDRRARDGRRPGKKGMDATALPNAHPRRAGTSPGAPPALGRRRAKGIEGFSPRDPAAQIQKEGAGVAWRQSQSPLLGFPLPLHGRVPRVEGEGGRAAAPLGEGVGVSPPRRAVRGGSRGPGREQDHFAARERRAVPEGGKSRTSRGQGAGTEAATTDVNP